MRFFIFAAVFLFSSAPLGAAEIDTSSICKVYSQIQTSNGVSYKVGTGFVYSEDEEDYFILTNAHTLYNAAFPKVSFYKDNKLSKLIDADINFNMFEDGTSNDVAVISVDKDSLPYEIKCVNIDFKDYDYFDGDIFGAGYPNGLWLQEWKSNSIKHNFSTIGIITSGPVGGQSGSPVFIDKDGVNYCIGMLSYRFSKVVSNNPFPKMTKGGYIKMGHINNLISGKKVDVERVPDFDALSTTQNEIQNTKYYVIVDQNNKIIAYDENGPFFYTENEFFPLKAGESYFPADIHPACRGSFKRFLRRMRNGLPTLVPPKEPLPPFDRLQPQPQPTVPPAPKKAPVPKESTPKSPKESPKESPKQFEESKPEPEKSKPDNADLERQIRDLERKLEEKERYYKQLNDDSLRAQRRVLEEQIIALKNEIERLKCKPAPPPVETPKPDTSNPDTPENAQDGPVGRFFGFLGSLPGKALDGLKGLTGLSQNGVIWSLIGIVGPFLIPGVRQFAVAKGISPVAIKGGEYLFRFAGWLKKGKTGKEVGGSYINNEMQDFDNSLDISDPKFINPDYDGNNVYVASTQIPSAQTPVYKETSENIQKDVNKGDEKVYNDTQMRDIIDSMDASHLKVPNSIKSFIDMVIANGQRIETLVMHGNLYKEGVRKLKNGELTDKSSAPIQGGKKIAEAVEKYVRDEYVTRNDYETLQSELAKNYLVAYQGQLYKQAVQELAKNNLAVLNHKDAAEAIEEYVKQELYKKLLGD